MNKAIATILSSFLLWVLSLPFVVLANANGWGKYGSQPLQILDNLAQDANKINRIQETQLDDVSPLQGSYPAQYRLSNTMDSIRQNLWPYIRWAYFIGLAVAVIAIIYNGLLMVTNDLHGKGDRWEGKKRLVNIIIGVIILTWVYALLAIMMALIGRIL